MADTKKATVTAGVNGDGRRLDLDFFAMLLRDELTGDDQALAVSAGDVLVAAALLRELAAAYSGSDAAALAREVADRLAAGAGDGTAYEPGQIIV